MNQCVCVGGDLACPVNTGHTSIAVSSAYGLLSCRVLMVPASRTESVCQQDLKAAQSHRLSLAAPELKRACAAQCIGKGVPGNEGVRITSCGGGCWEG